MDVLLSLAGAGARDCVQGSEAWHQLPGTYQGFGFPESF